MSVRLRVDGREVGDPRVIQPDTLAGCATVELHLARPDGHDEPRHPAGTERAEVVRGVVGVFGRPAKPSAAAHADHQADVCPARGSAATLWAFVPIPGLVGGDEDHGATWAFHAPCRVPEDLGPSPIAAACLPL